MVNLRPGSIIKGAYWPEPVEIKLIEEQGQYRIKELILEIYDKMSEAIETGQSYQTILDPPPAGPSVAHPPKEDQR